MSYWMTNYKPMKQSFYVKTQANKSAMKEAVKHRVWPARRFAYCGGLNVDIRRMAPASLPRKNVELNRKCCRWCLFAVTCFKNWTSFTVPVSYLRLALLTGSLWSYRVVALNDGRLTNGWNSQICFYGLWIKFRDWPPPAPDIHLLTTNGLSIGSLSNKRNTRRGVIILRRWKPDFNGSRKPVFHPTIGREGAHSHFQ